LCHETNSAGRRDESVRLVGRHAEAPEPRGEPLEPQAESIHERGVDPGLLRILPCESRDSRREGTAARSA
jgi:hypothetical protein